MVAVPGHGPIATVLVIDDDEKNLVFAREVLADEGYKVVLASGGVDGVRAFESASPDCVLLDVRMPEMDGFAVCRQLRATPEGSSVPILILTALRDTDTFDKALAAGADDFVSKPVRPAELATRVATALETRRLGSELREHYALIRRQRDDLIRLQLQKERLTAFVVHDLKNPISAIDLHTQFLKSEEGLSTEAKESIELIQREIRLLNRMVLNLRDVSRADEGKLAVEAGDVGLNSLVEEVIAEHRAAAEERKLTLVVEVESDATTVLGDGDLLRRALANLVDNAIRHAPTGSVVGVWTACHGARVEARVSDAGPGVPVEARAAVFDAADRSETSGSSRVGRALGLAFCKLVAEAHGGSIWVEDGAPGAVFCLSIPNPR